MFGLAGRGVRSLYGIAVYDLCDEHARRCCDELERMEEHVETGGDVNRARTRLGIQAVHDTERRAQRPIRDASLGEQRLVVEDGSSSCTRQTC